MTREPNAVDFWRGFALITIFIDHVPGLIYASYTLANVSIADAADLFVFLAGWSLRLMAEGRGEPRPIRDVMLRLFGRALEIYAAQVLITMLAIAFLALSATELDNPLLLQWHNAAAVFTDPVPTHIGLAVLTHQLGYFDILPLYVVLMLMAPFFALIDRVAPMLLLPLSLALYLCVLAFRLTLPTWPVAGTWFFNPLAWQAVFVLGFCLAAPNRGAGAFARRHIARLRVIGVPIVIAGAVIHLFDLWPDPTKVPNPKLFFIADKTFMTPMRLIQFLSLVAVFSVAWPYIRRAAAAPAFGRAGRRADRPVRHARAQFALRLLRRLAVEPVGAGGPALLSRLGRQRHGCGTARNPHHGIHRMARRIATARTACALVLGAALVGALTGLASGAADGRAAGIAAGRTRSYRRPACPARRAQNGEPTAAERRRGARGPQDAAHPGDRRRARPHRPARRQLYGADRAHAAGRAQGHRTSRSSTAASPASSPPTPQCACGTRWRWRSQTSCSGRSAPTTRSPTCPPAEFAATVKDQIAWLKAHKVDVVLVGLQFAPQMLRDAHYVEIRETLRRVAADEGVVVVRFFEAMQILNPASNESQMPAAEEFERNEAGYNCLAQYVARAITLGVFAKGLRQPAAGKTPGEK